MTWVEAARLSCQDSSSENSRFQRDSDEGSSRVSNSLKEMAGVWL